jgi:UDP-N-acetylmuramyl tripeptide synthase
MPQIIYFGYLGPNRRSDLRVVEARLTFTAEQAQEEGFEGFADHIRQLLITGGVLARAEAFPPDPFPDRSMENYASLLAQTALLFQRKAGHRVGFYEVSCEPERLRCTVLVEHEHCDVGMTAMKLAVELITGKRTLLAEPFRGFCEFARRRLLPLETEAIIAAARRQHIPCYQLERFPLTHQPGGPARIRNNGLLRLGAGARGRLLEGTILREETSEQVKSWLHNAEDRRGLLRSLGVQPAAAPPAGASQFHVVVVAGQVFALEALAGGRVQAVENIDGAVSELATKVYREAGKQAVSLLLVGEGLDRPLSSGSIQVLDFQLAPDLGALFSTDSGHAPGMLEMVADSLVKDLFPTPEQARIPIVAITGTNGKTTTSRMVSHIFQHAGLQPGLICTNGAFIDGKMLMAEDAGTVIGHTRMLVRDDIGSAVLETHHRGIFLRGFAFHDCDVAICLNVSEDHLDHGGIESLDEMVELKCALVKRASRAAVLFADNPGSCGMREHVKAKKLWLVSLESDIAGLRALAGDREASFSVLESMDGQEWLVLYDRDQRVELMESRQIPVTFDGAARFNVSNAMHAACAAFEIGVPADVIRAALAGFQVSREFTPGRLNVYDRLPFRVIVDNAHNPDGLQQLMKFVDLQAPAGRKVISFAGPSGRLEIFYRKMARAVAGHFDLYFCNDRIPKGKEKPDFFAPILRDELLACGIEQGKVLLGSRGREAWQQIFGNCAPGDLLILLLSPVEFEEARRFIEEFPNPRH